MIKEVAYYKREVQENEEKLQQMIDDGRDHYDVKKFREVLGESHMMVPDSERRLDQAVSDLRDFCSESNELDEGGEWYKQAKEILAGHAGTGAEKKNDPAATGESHEVVETKVDDLARGEVF